MEHWRLDYDDDIRMSMSCEPSVQGLRRIVQSSEPYGGPSGQGHNYSVSHLERIANFHLGYGAILLTCEPGSMGMIILLSRLVVPLPGAILILIWLRVVRPMRSSSPPGGAA
jgi:hypothetical protein